MVTTNRAGADGGRISLRSASLVEPGKPFRPRNARYLRPLDDVALSAMAIFNPAPVSFI
jgi:hypothetical protein